MISKTNNKADGPSKPVKVRVAPSNTQRANGISPELHSQSVRALTAAIRNCKKARKMLNSGKIDVEKDQICIVYPVQSKDVMDSDVNLDQQENVGFADNVVGEQTAVPAVMKDFYLDSSNDVKLGNFLSRPVLIKTITWVENTEISDTVFPWRTYFEDPAIKRKLDNHYLLRCKLKIKVVLNASPFYYGCGLISYRPLQAYQPAIIYSGVGAGNIPLIARSQRPNICIYPQTSQGGEMELPFLYHKNWLDATSADDLEGMGILNFDSFTLLENANSVAGQGVTIQVYAWAEDVEILGPTIDMAVQSCDEYDKGVVSAPASALARYSSYFMNIPYLAPFATATNLISTAVGSAAKLFGYTNVPVIADVHAFKSQPFPQFASAHVGTPLEKLTLDPKNELSVDSRVAGVDLGDELMISSIVKRESFLYNAFWTATDAADHLIFAAAVNPAFCELNGLTSQNAIQYIPMGIPNMMFRNWRGDMVFRIKFICSQYHRGRAKIAWDPKGDISIVNETTSRVFTKIVDITSENDVEFIVPYMQPTSYLETEQQNRRFGGTPVTANSSDNGMLTIRVLTAQTSPVASADIRVLVFVKGSENLEFANPMDFAPDLSPYTVQSKDVFDSPVHSDMGLEPSKVSDSINLVHMGENIVSLRELMRRDCYVMTLSSGQAPSGTFASYEMKISRMPLYPGYDGGGINSASSYLGPGTVPYNYVKWTPINWVTQCFVGYRGAIHWHANPYFANETPIHSFHVVRNSVNPLSSSGYSFKTTATFSNFSGLAYQNIRLRGNLSSGSSVTNPTAQPALGVSAPMYSAFKMLPSTPSERTLGTSDLGTDRDSIQFTVNYIAKVTPTSGDRLTVDYFVSIGTDFNPIFFLNVPTLFEYSLPSP